jgi:hypothetical protein
MHFFPTSQIRISAQPLTHVRVRFHHSIVTTHDEHLSLFDVWLHHGACANTMFVTVTHTFQGTSTPFIIANLTHPQMFGSQFRNVFAQPRIAFLTGCMSEHQFVWEECSLIGYTKYLTNDVWCVTTNCGQIHLLFCLQFVPIGTAQTFTKLLKESGTVFSIFFNSECLMW